MNLLPQLRSLHGPLTQELLREPAQFGLGQLPASRLPDATVRTVCGFCATGCGLTVHLQDGEAVGISPETDWPVNLGMACPKGWESLTVLDAPDRAVEPLLRTTRDSRRVPVSWDRATNEFTRRMQQIQQQHGPQSIAFLSTGQMVTEEMAFLGALAKFGMGMLHGDGNTRQCMASAVVAYKQAFGFDAPPYTYADFEESDVIVLVGSNLCLTHPIMWERVMRNPHAPEIIVIDPRTTETAMNASLHLALRPQSDLVLLYGIARQLISEHAVDESFLSAHTSGFAEFSQFVQQFDLPTVTAHTGLSEQTLLRFTHLIRDGQRVSFWWTMGVNQSHQGVRTAQAVINLALMTGNIGRPGTGANSITGQCNAMGSRLFSNTTSLLGGHDFADSEHRRRVAEVLKIPESLIPQQASLAYDQILEEVLRGRIRGLWILCTNPAHSWINQNAARDILDRLDFLVVQDMYHSTETAQLADLLLPAAGWGEKEGTFINSERRIGVTRAVRHAPGTALSDFRIFRLLAQAWGCGDLFQEWTSPEKVFGILRELSRGRPCDFTGIPDYDQIAAAGGIQWPLPDQPARPNSAADETRIQQPQEIYEQHTTVAVEQERRLFSDGRFFHRDERARFLFEMPAAIREKTTVAYPFLLLTGRGSASQWHTQTRTSKSAVLQKLYPQHPFVELNPADARRLGISQNDRVIVESQRGAMSATAFLTLNVRPMQVFVPMHYPDTNRLTDAVFDPYSRQPAYKACAVRVRRRGDMMTVTHPADPQNSKTADENSAPDCTES